MNAHALACSSVKVVRLRLLNIAVLKIWATVGKATEEKLICMLLYKH